MKKKIILVIAMCIFVVSANAQKIGIKAGVSIADASIKAVTNFNPESIVGIHAGVIVESKSLLNMLYLNSGLMYTQKGFSLDTGIESLEGDTKINYIGVPLNVGVKFGVGPLKLFAQAGPYVDFAVNGKTKLGDVSTDMDFGKDKWSRLDIGASLSAGVEVSIVQISLNYNFGLSDISNFDSTIKTDIKNGVFGISAAVLF